jgi:hypothetical protein
VSNILGDEIPIEVKRSIIDQERKLYLNTRYQLQVRYRVNKTIGAEQAVLQDLEKELTRCEKIIDALAAELEALN